MRTLVFLLQKASEVTRLFNKKKSGSRARERVKVLDNLNSVLQNPESTVHEIEEAEKKFTEFDEEDIREVLKKNLAKRGYEAPLPHPYPFPDRVNVEKLTFQCIDLQQLQK